MWFFTLALLGILVLVVKYISQKRCNLPGPRGWPFIGIVSQLKKGQTHLTIAEWAKKYGDIFQMKMFGENYVVINAYESIYEALVKKSNDFAGRPPSFRQSFLMNGSYDVAFTTFSPKWVYLKKITMTTLRMYGDNMANLERLSLEQIEEMLEEIKEASHSSTAVNIVASIHHCVTGIMTSILYGKKETKEKVDTLGKLSFEGRIIAEQTGIFALLDFIPWLRFLPFGPFKKIYYVRDKTFQWYLSELEERKGKCLPGAPECFIDGLFDHQRETDKNQAKIRLTESDIVGIMRDMILAGTVTTTGTMSALIIILLNKTDIQQKMADDITMVLKKRPPSLADRSSLPYIEAVILEILRYTSLLPLSFPHYTTMDTSVNGVELSKDTKIIFNFWHLHHSEDYWKNPWEFSPERFLDEEGNLVPPDHMNRKRLLAFGAGRRVCPGENLARNRLFLLVVSILQHFRLEALSPDDIPSCDARTFQATFTINMVPYQVKVIPRT